MQIEKNLLIQRVLFIWYWTLSGVGFFNEFFHLEGLYHAVNLAADVVIVALAMVTIKHWIDWAVIGSYFVISYFITCLINGMDFVTWFNGSRVFYGVLFVMPVLRYFWDDRERHDRFIEALDKQLFVFLILMAITMTIQFLYYGPGDYVGGIFGAFSGIASITIYCVSFYLLRKNLDPDNMSYSLWQNWRYIVLLYPTFLNETKISLILIVLYFLLLTPIDRKLLSRLLVVLPVTTVMLVVGVVGYMYINQGRGGTNLFSEDFFVNYLVDEIDEAEGNAQYGLRTEDHALPDIPRMAKIALIHPVLEDNMVSPLTGLGVGLYKGGTTTEQTEFTKEYDWLMVGTSPYIFHLIMQLGYVGLVWAIAVFVLSFYTCHSRIYRRREWNIQLYFTAIVLALLVYGDLWREMCFSFMVLLFMQLSWVLPTKHDTE